MTDLADLVKDCPMCEGTGECYAGMRYGTDPVYGPCPCCQHAERAYAEGQKAQRAADVARVRQRGEDNHGYLNVAGTHSFLVAKLFRDLADELAKED